MDLRNAKPEDAKILSILAEEAMASNGYSDAKMQSILDVVIFTPEQCSTNRIRVLDLGSDYKHEIVGFYELSKVRDIFGDVELMSLYVKYRRQGIGKLLLESALMHSRAMAASVMYLTSSDEARNFYISMGASRLLTVENASNPGSHLSRFKFDID